MNSNRILALTKLPSFRDVDLGMEKYAKTHKYIICVQLYDISAMERNEVEQGTKKNSVVVGSSCVEDSQMLHEQRCEGNYRQVTWIVGKM